MKKQKKGFSLIELLIVVAIILIIAAIAIPNLLKSRIAANEASAAASVRTIATGEITYFTTYNNYATLAGLGSASIKLVDSQLSSGAKSGYSFQVTDNDSSQFSANGNPQSTSTGNRSFCAVEDGVVRVNTGNINSHGTCAGLNALN